MNEISSKFKRQIEILGIAIKNTESLGTNDLAQMYNVERLTIKRDLQELRNNGIDIHSEGKKGIQLSRKLDEARLRKLISSYLALSHLASPLDKAGSLLVRRFGNDSLSTVVVLGKCIEDCIDVKIMYESERSKSPTMFVVSPQRFFQAEGMWRLLATHSGTLKQFLLTKIVQAEATGTSSTPVGDEQIDLVFRDSFFAWTGIRRHKIRLRLDREWAKKLKSRQLLMADSVDENSDGSVTVEMAVNSLDEIARWIVGRGSGIVVKKPKKLLDRVISIARQSLSNYGTSP